MEYIWKIILYGLIFVAVNVTNKKLRKNIDDANDLNGNEFCIDQKSYSKFFKKFAVVAAVVVIIFSLFSANIVIAVILIVSIAFLYIYGVMCELWYIKITEEGIFYRDYFGKVTSIPYGMVSKGIISRDNFLEIYVDNKNVATVTGSQTQALALRHLKKNNIEVEYAEDINNFVTKEDVGAKFIAYVGGCVFLGFWIFSFAVGEISGIIFFGGCVIVDAIYIWSMNYNQLMIQNKTIIQKRLMRKTRTISFSQIKCVEIKKYNNLPTIYLYVDDNTKLKVSGSWINYQLLEQLSLKQRWKRK